MIGKLLFKIKYDPMNNYAEKMKEPFNSVEYGEPDFSANTNVKTIDNYLEQEKKIKELTENYCELVKKDSEDLKKMIEEMKRDDEKRSKKWIDQHIFNPGCNVNYVMYGPPNNDVVPRTILGESAGNIVSGGRGR